MADIRGEIRVYLFFISFIFEQCLHRNWCAMTAYSSSTYCQSIRLIGWMYAMQRTIRPRFQSWVRFFFFFSLANCPWIVSSLNCTGTYWVDISKYIVTGLFVHGFKIGLGFFYLSLFFRGRIVLSLKYIQIYTWNISNQCVYEWIYNIYRDRTIRPRFQG